MTDEELVAIRSRNEKRKKNYGESQQRADGEMYTVGADEDIDALLAEVERLRAEKYGNELAVRKAERFIGDLGQNINYRAWLESTKND